MAHHLVVGALPRLGARVDLRLHEVELALADQDSGMNEGRRGGLDGRLPRERRGAGRGGGNGGDGESGGTDDRDGRCSDTSEHVELLAGDRPRGWREISTEGLDDRSYNRGRQVPVKLFRKVS